MNPTQEQPHTPGALADLTPAETLRCAARYLELHGWTQGVYYRVAHDSPFPQACVAGAIGMAAHGRCIWLPHDDKAKPGVRDYTRALDALSDYLDLNESQSRDAEDEDPTCPLSWNDRPGQTAEQVITTLRAAADDYDWSHTTEDDLETYADACAWADKHTTREGFLAWLGAR
ncbi:DUF6197 family protein [Micromonospora inositola]|uniref:Uncharacterized protein n=1 Tax=Micromonospora inositola TaxID=47865 RepID=A0A1C5HCN3_9ACTN|nr:hypothetical protein [Micromonospora inositola]SCG43750.1 hypothetical protein GA0070613_1131 [Micromonospora inositola]